MANLGLCRACKGKVKSVAAACPHCGQPNPYEDRLGQVRALVAGGQKIEVENSAIGPEGPSDPERERSRRAIKVYRELAGCDLAEAKTFDDSLVKNRY